MTKEASILLTAVGQRDFFIFMGKVTCVCDNVQAELNDVFLTDVADVMDLEKVVQYCIKNQKNATILYELPMSLWNDLSDNSLKYLYNQLELKRIGLNQIQKWLDSRDVPRHEKLKKLLSENR